MPAAIGSEVAVIGDFNVDMLATFACDPWASDDSGQLHHTERRMLLESLIER